MDDIRAMTVYQYRSYLEHIIEVERLFNGRPTKEEGGDEETEEEKLSAEDLLQLCRENKIRVPHE